MKAEEVRNFLLSIPHFSRLGSADLVALDRAMDVREVPAGHEFFTQGDAADGIYLVISGEVAVEYDAAMGSTTEVNRMVDREMFGILALLDDIPRTASCRAIGPCTVGYLPKQVFHALAGSRASIAYPFQRALGRQLARDFRTASARLGSLFEG